MIRQKTSRTYGKSTKIRRRRQTNNARNQCALYIMRPVRLSDRYQERFKKTLHLYKGKAVGFRCDQVSVPHHQTAQREFLTHPGAVGVLAFETPRKILLVKQYRYPI